MTFSQAARDSQSYHQRRDGVRLAAIDYDNGCSPTSGVPNKQTPCLTDQKDQEEDMFLRIPGNRRYFRTSQNGGFFTFAGLMHPQSRRAEPGFTYDP